MGNAHINNYKTKDFSKLLSVLAETLQRWDNGGILKTLRTTGRRYYTYGQYLRFKWIKGGEY